MAQLHTVEDVYYGDALEVGGVNGKSVFGGLRGSRVRIRRTKFREDRMREPKVIRLCSRRGMVKRKGSWKARQANAAVGRAARAARGTQSISAFLPGTTITHHHMHVTSHHISLITIITITITIAAD